LKAHHLVTKSKAARPAAASKAPPSPRAPLAELGIGAAWLVGLSAVNQIIAILFRANVIAPVVAQAVVVDLALGRAGIRWDPAANDDTSIEARNAARGIALGAGLALAAAALTVGAGAALGWAKVGAHAPGASLFLGLVRAAGIGVRDALLYIGLPLHFVGRARVVPRRAAALFGALAGGAALALQPTATPANVALAAAVTALAAALWLEAGAGWRALGVAVGWAFFAGSVFRGALIDVEWQRGTLAAGLSADGAPTWIAAALFAAAAVAAPRLHAGAAGPHGPRSA
jgi:hypothetical protein